MLELLLLPVALLLSGYVFQQFWFWFLIPLGLPSITFVHACGLRLIASLASYRSTNPKDQDTQSLLRVTVEYTVYNLIILVLGWFVHLFLTV